MSIISKETWDKFTEEEKERVRQGYKSWLYAYNKGGIEFSIHEEYEDLFGKENLQPEPKIKTWEDITKMDNRYHQLIDEIIRRGYSSLWDSKIINKIIATLKISKLIELGYGGMVTEEEWENEDIRKFSIVRFQKDLSYAEGRSAYEFVSFHTPEQREEFMSYPENVELVKQYYMI